MARFNATEHIGLHEVGLIFLREIGWVFRQQETADVGMDALVEEAVDGNPSGRFLMIQVKSGLGNVASSARAFSYYMSDVHFKYYMQVEMPVLFTLYSPNDSCCWWSPVNDETVVPSGVRWKLTIDRGSVLEASSRTRLTAILDNYNSNNSDPALAYRHERNLEELLSDIKKIHGVAPRLNEITKAQSDFNTALQLITSSLDLFNKRGLGEQSMEVKTAIGKANTQLLKMANRVLENSRLYSNLFTASASALEVLLQRIGNEEQLRIQYPSLLTVMANLRSSLDTCIVQIEGLLHSIEALPTRHARLKPGRTRAITAVDALIGNLRDSRTLTMRLILLVEA